VAARAVEDPILLTGITPVVYASDDSGFGQPFHTVALSDSDNVTFTATATLSSLAHAYFGSSYNATISGGVFSTSGALSTVTTALHDLVIYTSSLGLPSGQTETVGVTMSITDGLSETINATSTLVIVAASSADAAGLSVIGATPGQTTSDQASITPFASVVVVDKAVGTLDTVTVVMSDTADGTFSDALGGTVTGGTFTVSGTVDNNGFDSAINTILEALVFTPTRGQVPLGHSVTTGFTIAASNRLGSTTDRATSVIATAGGGQLAIDGAKANQAFSDITRAQLFADVTIFDTQITPTETATVALSNVSAGTLTAAGGGTVGADGVFRVSGTKAVVHAALQALGFTPEHLAPAAVASTNTTISVSDGTLSATDTTTSLIVVGSGTADYGAARFVSTAGTLSAGGGANEYVLNLGTVALDAVIATVTLGVSNIAGAAADALNGAFSLLPGTGFGDSGFAGFSSLSAGGTVDVAGLTLGTSHQGSFRETVTLTPTDVSAAYAQVQAAQMLALQFDVACFAVGTRIATPSGEVAVDRLRVGHEVLGPWGERMAVRWLGHRRVDCARHPTPADVLPVRVRAHAFRPGVPARDVLLSPDHAVFLAPPCMRPVLIPVRFLIDGESVIQERRARVTYWHVELERHAVLLAEGLPCESYLDTGNRDAFVNGGAAVQIHPDFAVRRWEAHACAPQVRGGPALHWARASLAARRADTAVAPSRRRTARRR
jgi:collagen type I alpha